MPAPIRISIEIIIIIMTRNFGVALRLYCKSFLSECCFIRSCEDVVIFIGSFILGWDVCFICCCGSSCI